MHIGQAVYCIPISCVGRGVGMRRSLHRPFRPRHRFPVAATPVVLTLFATAVFFIRLSARLKPLVETIAVSNAVNHISLAISDAAAESLLSNTVGYSGFVDVATDANGRVSSLSIKAAESSEFKARFISCLCRHLELIEAQDLAVPLGNLSGILWFSALGPDIRVMVRSIGDVSAEYENEFTGVGVNQTRHAVYLRVSVTIQLMIPGDIIPVTAEERVCIAETVIVGEVPDSYLNLQDGDN